MVLTASARHAVRVQQAVLQAFSKLPQYREFLLGERAEPFAVLTLEQAMAQSRDRVIFSIGYGRTPHGRVLSNFGSLGRPGGERRIAVGMTRARRGMSVSYTHLDVYKRQHLLCAPCQELVARRPLSAGSASWCVRASACSSCRLGARHLTASHIG